MNKKIIALVLSLTMTAALLAGCGNKQETPAGETPDTTQTVDTVKPAENETPEVNTEEKAEESEEAKQQNRIAEARKLYELFLADETTAKTRVGDFVYGDEEVIADYTLTDILNAVAEYQEMKAVEVNYAYIDCGNDGFPELAVAAGFSDTTNEYSDVYTNYFVVTAYDGALKVAGSVIGYYRSWATLNKYGVFQTGGSNGAASHYFDMQYITPEGELKFLYSTETDFTGMEGWIPVWNLSYEAQSKVYDLYGEETDSYDYGDYETDINNISNDAGEYDTYYCFFGAESEVTPPEDLLAIYQEEGVVILSLDELNAKIAERSAAVGLTDEMIYAEELEWTSMEVPAGCAKARVPYAFEDVTDLVRNLVGTWEYVPSEDHGSAVTIMIDEDADYVLTYRDEIGNETNMKGHLIFDVYNEYGGEEVACPDAVYFYLEETTIKAFENCEYMGCFVLSSFLKGSESAKLNLYKVYDGDTFFSWFYEDDFPTLERNAVETASLSRYTFVHNPGNGYWLNEEKVGDQKAQITYTLKQTECTENEIIDTDKWFAKVGWSELGTEYYDDDYYYYEYGTEKWWIYTKCSIYDASTKKSLYSFDLHEFKYADGYSSSNSFIGEGMNHALIVGGVLYLNITHRTYSSSCPENAFMLAVDLGSGELLWKSDNLVSNVATFAVIGDYVITGYGFTDEKDYIYLLDRFTGKVVEKYPVKNSPEQIYVKDGKVYVRCYSYDYVFEIVE